MAKFSKKASPFPVYVRGVMVRGFGGPVHQDTMTCNVCGYPIRPAFYTPCLEGDKVEPCYGACVNGHTIVDRMVAMMADEPNCHHCDQDWDNPNEECFACLSIVLDARKQLAEIQAKPWTYS